MIAIPLAIVVASFADLFNVFIYGQGFTLAIPPLRVLAVSIPFIYLGSVLVNVLVSSDHLARAAGHRCRVRYQRRRQSPVDPGLRFESREERIMDRTHLRFFTTRSAGAMILKAGYEVLEFHPGATRMPVILLKAWPTLCAVHLVFKIAPREGGA
jgi:ABC-type proline/glycine betaine transport system permease subunit